MLKKSYNLLKNNPVIIMFYATYMLIMVLIILALYPKDFSQFYSTTYTADFNFVAYAITMIKMLIALLLMSILGLVFFSGFGYMISEAASKGKTSYDSFLPGLKKYFVRTLLAMLLLTAFYFGISLVLSLLIIPVTIYMVLTGASSIYLISIITPLIICVLLIFILPFIMLWFPSIFIDDVGVIQGLKNGAKATVKNYWKLTLVILMIYIPMALYLLIDYDSIIAGDLFTLGYFVTILISSVMSIFAISIMFIIYFEYKQNRIHNQSEIYAKLD